MPSLRITEIFYSLQGEAKTVGIPTVFVRLTGCPLRCYYCDTTYAFAGGLARELDDLVTEIQGYRCQYVTVTGGEPLAQPNCLKFLTVLCDQGFLVSLETSGALDISEVDPRLSIVMDLKTPASGEVKRNIYANIEYLKTKDQLKFVLANREDYDWATFKINEYDLPGKVGEILMSPVHGELDARQLAEWILEDRLNVRLQIQLHKLLWGDKPGV